MIRLAAVCALSACLVGCSAAGGGFRGEGLVEASSPISPAPLDRTIAYRTSSFTDPTMDVSPDGRRLYFSAMGEIYVVPIEGGMAEPLALGAGWKDRPVISSDGLSIGFLADAGAGVAAWRRPLSGDRAPLGAVIPGFEATTLAWIDAASLGSAVASTSRYAQLGVVIDYEGEHGGIRPQGRAPSALPGPPRYPAASMSADHDGNVYLHRTEGIVRIDGATGLEEIIVPAGDPGAVSQPRVTADGSWLGFVSTSGGPARLMLKDLATGDVRDPGCRVNAEPRSSVQYNVNPEPAWAFIPGQPAVVLERDGQFLRCAFDGVETPIPVQADVRLAVADRIRPTPSRESGGPGLPLDLASTADGLAVAFIERGRLWLHDGSDGPRRISTSDVEERAPAFSADGRYLAYVERLQDQSSNLKIVDLRDGGSRVLLHSTGALGGPAWSPDDRRIAFIEKPVTGRAEPVLRWIGLNGSAGVVGPVAISSPNAFPALAWNRPGSALEYVQDGTLVSHPLEGGTRLLLSVDRRVWDVRVSPSRRLVALRTRDAVYIAPVLLSSRDRPTFSWSDIRAMTRIRVGGADHLQWLADDSLIWTVQHKLMRARAGRGARTARLDGRHGHLVGSARRHP